MDEDDGCSAVLRWQTETIRCDHPSGHWGAHGGSTERSDIRWSTDGAKGRTTICGVSGPSDEERVDSYGDIEVDRCVFCEAREVDTAFVFVQPRGLRVAVPGRVGLCTDCVTLLRNDDVDGALDRTRHTPLADFPDDAVLELIRATRAALPQ